MNIEVVCRPGVAALPSVRKNYLFTAPVDVMDAPEIRPIFSGASARIKSMRSKCGPGDIGSCWIIISKKFPDLLILELKLTGLFVFLKCDQDIAPGACSI